MESADFWSLIKTASNIYSITRFHSVHHWTLSSQLVSHSMMQSHLGINRCGLFVIFWDLGTGYDRWLAIQHSREIRMSNSHIDWTFTSPCDHMVDFCSLCILLIFSWKFFSQLSWWSFWKTSSKDQLNCKLHLGAKLPSGDVLWKNWTDSKVYQPIHRQVCFHVTSWAVDFQQC